MLSQKAQVLAHLKECKSITSWEAIRQYQATRLSAIIFDLKDDGYDIVMTPEHSDNGKKWWGRYNYLGRVTNGE